MSGRAGMKKRYTVSSAKCPYYREQEAQKIICEGFEHSSAIHATFATPSQREDYQKKYCFTHWNRCGITCGHRCMEEEE